MLERDIQRQILDYLTLKRVFHYRENTGAVAAESNGKKRFFRFGRPGCPDIVCIVKGQYIGIEVKAPKGVQSVVQRQFQTDLEMAGGKYLLVHSLEELMAAGL